ncbi:hypothetical protein [Candidatus Vondammii sp. HM_W22]|uniref:hypothetical protein n=1 Tax=Candidatus Vondammii sp. HM_W22 TaxID=2687299 RepID=UPI002E7AD62C|nr:hypothetical protein [Candidatus Vondammii sp. HM_W22]
MNIIPCRQNKELRKKIEEFAEVLKTESHTLGSHGLSESEFYNSGLFRGSIERIRGQFSATMRGKREFVQHVLNHMQDNDFIDEWGSASEANRHDYSVQLNSGKTAIIELKGCLDGNNTNIFERPPHAEEFVLWSLCTNLGADPQRNAWSGIHTRLSAEIIHRSQLVNGVIIWDMVCGTLGRPCPKIEEDAGRMTEVGPFKLPPPCIYVMPATIPSQRNNPSPQPQKIENVEILKAFHECFQGLDEEVNSVAFEVKNRGKDVVRKTQVSRNGEVQQESKATPIRRS